MDHNQKLQQKPADVSGSVEKICKNHLPQCLMERLNTVMNDIEIDNFDNVRCYKEQIKINKLQECSDKSDYNSNTVTNTI